MATSKSRVAKFREKLKEDPIKYQQHLEKEKIRDKQRREAKKKQRLKPDGLKALKLKRLTDAERQRRHRQKVKQQLNKPVIAKKNQDSLLGSYNCKHTLHKAVKRTQRLLPISPRKREAVVRKLVADELPVVKELLDNIGQKQPIRQTDESTKDKVNAFYLRDDISRQEPGKWDVKSVKDTQTGKRSLYQKRFMVMTVREAFNLFKDENPNCSIKKSKFYELRPPYVLPVSDMPHNVCVCRYHANMDFLIQSVKSSVNNFPCNGKELINSIVCDSSSELCMTDKCQNCTDPDGICIKNLVQPDFMKNEITWKQWSDEFERSKLVEKRGTISACLEEIRKQFVHYKSHVFIKKIQASYFEECKNSLKYGEAVLQIDFAENFSATMQDEIQSAHWSHQQITLFTAVASLKDGVKKCMVVVSDDLLHGKLSVWVFLRSIITNLKAQYDINYVKIFSDGCAAQFKNKFTLSNLQCMMKDFGLMGEWNFFASSHRKGAVGGVGGTVKRAVWTAVKGRKYLVSTAEDFAKCAREQMKGIDVLYTTSEEVAAQKDFLTKRWESVLPIVKLQSMHHFVPSMTKCSELLVGMTAKSEMNEATVYKNSDAELEECDVANTPNINSEIFRVGDFVKVSLLVDCKNHLQRQYYAEVTQIDIEASEVCLNYMYPTGNYWIWPENKDVSWESIAAATKVNPPTLINNRGQFQFT